MVFLRQARWLYAVASSGIALGAYSYLRPEKKQVQASWTTPYQPSYKWDYNWDKRDLSSLIKPAKNEDDVKEQNRINEEREKLMPTAYKHILLIRHGQYTKAEKPEDQKLTELGREQAEYVGQRLKEMDQRLKRLGFNYKKLTRSTMTRAVETSDIIRQYLPDVPTESDDMLREGSPILPEPCPPDNGNPDHEYFQDGARIEAAFRKYFYRADASEKSKAFYEIIVCHANVIRYFLCRALQIPPEAWLNFTLSNCSITHIVITPNGEIIVIAVGDAGFIPIDKKTFS